MLLQCFDCFCSRAPSFPLNTRACLHPPSMYASILQSSVSELATPRDKRLIFLNRVYPLSNPCTIKEPQLLIAARSRLLHACDSIPSQCNVIKNGHGRVAIVSFQENNGSAWCFQVPGVIQTTLPGRPVADKIGTQNFKSTQADARLQGGHLFDAHSHAHPPSDCHRTPSCTVVL